MRKLLKVLAALVVVVALAAGSLLVYLRHNTGGFSARTGPTRLESLLATAARRAATPAAVRDQRNPLAATPAVLQAAMVHYADHCAQCHGINGAGQTMLALGMYPKPPDMRLAATQRKTDGELFSVIENGVRLSGMPAFGGNGSNEAESWQLVTFLRHLPALTVEEEQAMQAMTPRTPAEMQEEQQERQFLQGAGSNTSMK